MVGSPSGYSSNDSLHGKQTTLVERSRSLATRVRWFGPLKEEAAVSWTIRLAKRVEQLHALGLTHGDISANTITTRGLDRAAEGVLGAASLGRSPINYHSPERLRGLAPTPTDDTWAVAVLLHFLLTGTFPYERGTTRSLLTAIGSRQRTRLAEHGIRDGALDAILGKALSSDLAARLVSVSALRRALEEWHPDPAVRHIAPLDEAKPRPLERAGSTGSPSRAPLSVSRRVVPPPSRRPPRPAPGRERTPPRPADSGVARAAGELGHLSEALDSELGLDVSLDELADELNREVDLDDDLADEDLPLVRPPAAQDDRDDEEPTLEVVPLGDVERALPSPGPAPRQGSRAPRLQLAEPAPGAEERAAWRTWAAATACLLGLEALALLAYWLLAS